MSAQEVSSILSLCSTISIFMMILMGIITLSFCLRRERHLHYVLFLCALGFFIIQGVAMLLVNDIHSRIAYLGWFSEAFDVMVIAGNCCMIAGLCSFLRHAKGNGLHQ